MRIDLGRRGDYAIRAGLMLARHTDGGLVKSREVAATMAIPERFVIHILADLVRAGLVESTAGPRGGYRLAGAPEQTSVLALVEATEGDLRARTCPLRGGPCPSEEVCVLHEDWLEAQEAFLGRLAATSLRSLADRDDGDVARPAPV